MKAELVILLALISFSFECYGVYGTIYGPEDCNKQHKDTFPTIQDTSYSYKCCWIHYNWQSESSPEKEYDECIQVSYVQYYDMYNYWFTLKQYLTDTYISAGNVQSKVTSLDIHCKSSYLAISLLIGLFAFLF